MNLRLKELEGILFLVEQHLPDGFSFYSVDERKVFQMRGPAGGVVSSVVSYLLHEKEGRHFSYGITWPVNMVQDPYGHRKPLFDLTMEKVKDFQVKLNETPHTVEFDPDGGDMGVPEKPFKK